MEPPAAFAGFAQGGCGINDGLCDDCVFIRTPCRHIRQRPKFVQ